MKVLRNAFAIVALAFAPMTAMAVTPSNADATVCKECNGGVCVSKIVPLGWLTCTNAANHGEPCILSGVCIN